MIEVAFEAANKHEVPANQDKNLKDRICDKSLPSEKQGLLFLDLPMQNRFSSLDEDYTLSTPGNEESLFQNRKTLQSLCVTEMGNFYFLIRA